MTRRMLIDATHSEETRVAVLDDDHLVDFDYESSLRKPLKGNVYLAKVTRVEPSLQAAFVNYGGNRHGFLPFSEIHPDYFRIPVADREALMAEQEAALREAEEREALEAQEDARLAAAEAAGEIPPTQSENLSAENNVVEAAEIEVYDDTADEDDSDILTAMVEGGDGDDESAHADSPFSEEHASAGEGDDFPAEDGEEGEVSDADGHNPEGENSERDRPFDGRRGRGRNGRNGRGGRNGRNNNNRPLRQRSSEKYDDMDEETRFRFNLRRKYKIQEVIKRGQIMLIQVNKEERGNKGAAVGSYLSLPGRYCVLMPNSPRAGGISRKIANYKDRHRMREIIRELEVPKGMSVILRTAGVERTKAEIKRDLDYLIRLWNQIREDTLQASAPALIYEEADLIKRAVRDLYARDVDEIIVAGEEGYKVAKNFMKMLMPSHVKKVSLYENAQLPLFNKYHAEHQIAEIGETQVRLPSGGYLVINPTEALVSIDVNSGRATKERHIEETALRTNLEAAEEVARQLRLRDLGGLVVIDFIDMENRRYNAKVERKMREALAGDRARIQVGRISSFGLMELSRQRISASLNEAQFEHCDHCNGTGRVRTADANSVMLLRAIEQEGLKGRAAQVIAHVASEVALYILNNKRHALAALEERFNIEVLIRVDENVGRSGHRVEVSKPIEALRVREDEDEESFAQSQRNRNARPNHKPRRKSDDVTNLVDEIQEDGDVDDADAAEDFIEDNVGNTHESSAQINDKRERRGNRRGGRGRRFDGNRRDKDEQRSSSDEKMNVQDNRMVPDVDANQKAEKPSNVISAGDEKVAKKPASRAVAKKNKPEPKSGDVLKEPKDTKDSAKGVKEPKEPKEAKESKVKNSVAEAKPKPVRSAASKAEKKETEPKAYEVVNAPPEEKKSGWWNKLTS